MQSKYCILKYIEGKCYHLQEIVPINVKIIAVLLLKCRVCVQKVESLFCDFMCTIKHPYSLFIFSQTNESFHLKLVFEHIWFPLHSNKNVNWVTKTISELNDVWSSLYGDDSVGKSNMFGLKYLRKFSSCNLTPKSSGPYCKPRQAARN